MIRQRFLPVSALQEGMILARPLVITEHGRVLLRLPAGQVLTEAGLEQLQARHAEYACVEMLDSRSDAEREADEAKLDARQQQIFRYADMDSPAVAALFNALLQYRKSQ